MAVGMQMELQYVDLAERFRTRLLYTDAENHDACLEDYNEACHIQNMWQELTDQAEMVDCSLEDTKKRFSETTREQVTVMFSFRYILWTVERELIAMTEPIGWPRLLGFPSRDFLYLYCTCSWQI